MYVKIIRNVGLKVKRSEMIKNLKTMLRGKYGIPESQQELFFNGDRLMDGQKLFDCGVHRDSILHLVHHDFDGIKIHVKLPSNRSTMVIEARTQDTVRNIKAIIKTKEDIELDQFTLVYAGKLLEDDSTLASLNFPSESTFHAVLNPTDVLSIYVKSVLSGVDIRVTAKALFTVNDLKTIVESMTDVSFTNHTVIYKGKQLEDCKTLAFYDVKEGSVLEMFGPKIQILIKTWSGKTITLNVNQSDTVGIVKKKLFQKLRIPDHYLNLVFSGKLLEDARDLATYNIQQHSTLHAGYALSTIQINLATFCDLSESTTVRSLKQLIHERLKTPVKEVYLHEVALEDDHTLVYYGILNADIILGVSS